MHWIAEFSQHMSHLCMNAEYSDVTFVVEGVKLPAHKIILAARSSYFRALLYGGLAETTQSEIELNVPLDAFKALLEYIYTGCMSLVKMKEENILDSLGLANQYGFETLELAISTYLTNSLSLKNCCAILDAARLYNLDTLSDFTLTFMDRNSLELLNSSTFKTLSQDSLCTLLQRDSFFAPEVNIFNAVYDWCKNNPSADIEVSILFNCFFFKRKFLKNYSIVSGKKIMKRSGNQTRFDEIFIKMWKFSEISGKNAKIFWDFLKNEFLAKMGKFRTNCHNLHFKMCKIWNFLIFLVDGRIIRSITINGSQAITENRSTMFNFGSKSTSRCDWRTNHIKESRLSWRPLWVNWMRIEICYKCLISNLINWFFMIIYFEFGMKKKMTNFYWISQGPKKTLHQQNLIRKQFEEKCGLLFSMVTLLITTWKKVPFYMKAIFSSKYEINSISLCQFRLYASLHQWFQWSIHHRRIGNNQYNKSHQNATVGSWPALLFILHWNISWPRQLGSSHWSHKVHVSFVAIFILFVTSCALH